MSRNVDRVLLVAVLDWLETALHVPALSVRAGWQKEAAIIRIVCVRAVWLAAEMAFVALFHLRASMM
jgi:hypothetical protein